MIVLRVSVNVPNLKLGLLSEPNPLHPILISIADRCCSWYLQRLKEIQQETADVASSEDSLSRLRRGSYSGPMIKTGSLREANSPSPLKRATNGRLPSVSQPDTVATQSSSSSTPHSQLTPS
eukprot:TRINITY_DN12599_c1_g5_i5.p1 TRINITY_DN12599_c1_g5~~TRINITY_DN12599_c1_g5_i5.p1  ORF type:complete len:122 (+),score=8.83 TRINITY_DN12599_c1_g5_i5:61-426(+)